MTTTTTDARTVRAVYRKLQADHRTAVLDHKVALGQETSRERTAELYGIKLGLALALGVIEAQARADGILSAVWGR